MGGGIELLDAALRVPPWQPLYQLSGDEIRRMGLNNVDHLFGAEPNRIAAEARAGANLANAAPLP
jgi:hypothetical protein